MTKQLTGTQPLSLTEGNEFNKTVKPKVLTKASDLFIFQCECGSIHHRHAGYIKTLIPYARPDKEQKVEACNHQLMVCTQCKNCYIWSDNQMYDVTTLIDLEAWDKTEREMQKATGPGGDC